MTADIHTLPRPVARSSAPDVRNPLLKLASVAGIVDLPDADRRALRLVLDDIRRQARFVADKLWARGRRRAAGYWRASSVYAGHIARLAYPRSVPSAAMTELPALGGINPILRLPAVKGLDQLPLQASLALEALLMELRETSRLTSDKSWATAKSPLAVYWADVFTFSGHCARHLRRGRAAAFAQVLPRLIAA
jgi:hypothetical protein